MNVTNSLTAKLYDGVIITTQEEFANVKAGDYLMPAETLSFDKSAFEYFTIGKYIHTSFQVFKK